MSGNRLKLTQVCTIHSSREEKLHDACQLCLIFSCLVEWQEDSPGVKAYKYKAAEGMVSWKEKVLVSFSVWERESPRNIFREMKVIRSRRLSQIQARDLGYRKEKKKVKEVAENWNVPSETKVRSLL